MKRVTDQVKVQDLFPSAKAMGSSGSREATVFSVPIKLGGARDFAIHMNCQHVSSVGPRDKVEAKILLGTTTYASPTAFTSLANSSFLVCASGATQTKVNWARVVMTGTITKITSAYTGLIIDGTTFTFNDTAHSSVSVHSTSGSVACAKLATSIKGMCTYLDATYYWTGAATGPAIVEIWPKDGDRVFDITSTSIYPGASADGLGLVVGRSACLEFKAEDIESASTIAYTHAVVRAQTTGTVCGLNGVLVSGSPRYLPAHNISRFMLATVSSKFAT